MAPSLFPKSGASSQPSAIHVWIKVDPVATTTQGSYRGRHLWFVMLEDHKTVIAECSSNEGLADEFRWTADEEDELRRLGWNEPDLSWTINWNLVRRGVEVLPSIGEITGDTLRLVFGLQSFDTVAIGFQRRLMAKVLS